MLRAFKNLATMGTVTVFSAATAKLQHYLRQGVPESDGTQDIERDRERRRVSNYLQGLEQVQAICRIRFKNELQELSTSLLGEED